MHKINAFHSTTLMTGLKRNFSPLFNATKASFGLQKTSILEFKACFEPYEFKQRVL